MACDLSDTQIALLCDIGEYDFAKASEDQKRDLEQLLSRGYVEPGGNNPGSPFKLTGKGAAFLTDRGAGLNEA